MTQIYSKQSFDRFGDDLSEAILSYLPLDDKTRLECVSKQTRRTIYRKQYDLVIDFSKNIFNAVKGTDALEKRAIDLKGFESVLKKCQMLNKIDINYCKFFEDQQRFEQIIGLVIDNCQNLTEIQYDFTQNSWQTIEKFFANFGPNLKSLELFEKQLIANKNLIFNSCLNLKSVRVFHLSDILDEQKDKCLIRNLKDIEFNYTKSDIKSIETFMRKNKNSLESIDIRVSAGCDDTAIEVLIRQLTEAYKLSKIKVNFSSELTIGCHFAHLFKQIGIKCFKLKSLELTLTSESIAINAEIFDSLKYYKLLKRLDLKLYTRPKGAEADWKPSLKSKSLRECQQLTHLTLNGLEVDDKFFRYADINVKRLQYLNVSEANISGVTFCLLSELPKLETIVINSNKSKPIDESIVYYLIGKAPKIKTIKYSSRGQRSLAFDQKTIYDVKQAFKFKLFTN